MKEFKEYFLVALGWLAVLFCILFGFVFALGFVDLILESGVNLSEEELIFSFADRILHGIVLSVFGGVLYIFLIYNLVNYKKTAQEITGFFISSKTWVKSQFKY